MPDGLAPTSVACRASREETCDLHGLSPSGRLRNSEETARKLSQRRSRRSSRLSLWVLTEIKDISKHGNLESVPLLPSISWGEFPEIDCCRARISCVAGNQVASLADLAVGRPIPIIATAMAKMVNTSATEGNCRAIFDRFDFIRTSVIGEANIVSYLKLSTQMYSCR